MSKKSERYIDADFLRGLAVIGMIIFHIFFILDFYGILKNEMYQGAWLVLARFVQITFLLLVGVFVALPGQKYKEAGLPHKSFLFKQWKRAFKIFLLAMIVSVATYVVVGNLYVRFGILHLIALGISVSSFVAYNKSLSLFLGVLSAIIGFWMGDIPVSSSLDYFPIFPWISVVFVGIWLGNLLYERKLMGILKAHKFMRPILLLGRNSLFIYMLHVPIIWGLVMLFKLL